MKNKRFIRFLIPFLLIQSQSVFAQKHSLIVNINGFENNNGKLYFQIQNPEKKTIYQTIAVISNKKVRIEVKDLAAGKYAVRVYHDENDNKKMDKNFIGLPSEGWGMSNNVKANFGPPNFEDSLFELKANKEISIDLN